MYTKPFRDIIQRHGLPHHSYADDTPLYMTMDHSNNDWWDGLARIELCVSEIRELMSQNMLKLNDDKTEFVVLTSKYKQDLYNDLCITIGDTVVDCRSQVRDLGATLIECYRYVSMCLLPEKRADVTSETLSEYGNAYHRKKVSSLPSHW